MESHNVTYQSVDNPEVSVSYPDGNLFGKGWAELDQVWKIVVYIGFGACVISMLAIISLCCGCSKRKMSKCFKRSKKITNTPDLELGTVPKTSQRVTEGSSSASKVPPGQSKKQHSMRTDSGSKIARPAKTEARHKRSAKAEIRTNRFERI